VQRREWADARYPNERTRGTYLPENLLPLEASGRLRLLNGDTVVTSEVRTLVTRGHTRAHQCVILESGNQTAIYLSDLAPLTVNLERLAWIPAFDAEPLETLETKRRL
jgi:glyoxylase-like metal-dependent hydrolase (beta-lactamase superfamily II)